MPSKPISSGSIKRDTKHLFLNPFVVTLSASHEDAKEDKAVLYLCVLFLDKARALLYVSLQLRLKNGAACNHNHAPNHLHTRWEFTHTAMQSHARLQLLIRSQLQSLDNPEALVSSWQTKEIGSCCGHL